MKKKVLILILFVLILLFSTTAYADHRYMTIAQEYLICSKALDIIKIITIIIAILVILQIVINKKIQNKIISKINLILLSCSIVVWCIAGIVWLINYIKIM